MRRRPGSLPSSKETTENTRRGLPPGPRRFAQHFSSLSVGELTKRGPPFDACKCQSLLKINSLRRYPRQLVPGDWIDERLSRTGAFAPLTIHVVRQLHLHASVDSQSRPKKGLLRMIRELQASKQIVNNTAYSLGLEPRLTLMQLHRLHCNRHKQNSLQSMVRFSKAVEHACDEPPIPA